MKNKFYMYNVLQKIFAHKNTLNQRKVKKY